MLQYVGFTYIVAMKVEKSATEFSCLEFSAQLQQRYPQYFLFPNNAISIHSALIDNLCESKVQLAQMDRSQRVYAWQSYKATESLVSLTKLIDAGLVGDGTSICRKILEQAIILKYIEADSVERTKKFENHRILTHRYFAEKVLKCNHVSASDRDQILRYQEESQRDYERARGVFGLKGKKEIPRKYLNNWSGLSLEKMAEKVGLGWEYLKVYRVFSLSVHADFSNHSAYFNEEESQFGPRHQVFEALAALFFGTRFYLSVLEVFSGSIGFQMDSIKKLQRELESVENSPELDSREFVFELGT